MDAVVLGAGGFCGRELVKTVLAGKEFERVIVLYRQAPGREQTDSRLIEVSGCLTTLDYASLFPDRPHVIFHFASSKDRLADNRLSCQRISNNLKSNCKGIFYGSSLSVYGDGPHDFVTESAPLCPQTELAKTRAQCEEILRESSVPVVCLRPRMIVGKEDEYFLPQMKKLFRRGITVGNEKQRFSFIEVKDYATIVLQLCTELLKSPDTIGNEYNVGYESPLSMFELRKILTPGKRVYFRIPVKTSVALLNMLRAKFVKRLSSKLSLIGLNQTLDARRLSKVVGHNILTRSPAEVVCKVAAESELPTEVEPENRTRQ